MTYRFAFIVRMTPGRISKPWLILTYPTSVLARSRIYGAVWLVLTEPFIKKLTLKEDVFGPFTFVGSANCSIHRAKPRLDKVKSLHSIRTKADASTEMQSDSLVP
jgi:hypothetical protein